MKCDLGDLAVFYETYGTGRPIVMLPGMPSDHRVMERFMEPLFTQRDGWLRLYPDLPGTGRTPGSDRLTTQDQMLDAVLAFIDTVLPGQRFVLAGLSYGGYLARGVVYRRAASIDGVLLCAPQVTAEPAQAHLPRRITLVEDPTLVAQLEPGIADLVVVQSHTVVEAVRAVLAEVQLADHTFLARLEAAGPFSFDVDTLPALGSAGQLPQSDLRCARSGRTFCEYRTGCAVPGPHARVVGSGGGMCHSLTAHGYPGHPCASVAWPCWP